MIGLIRASTSLDSRFHVMFPSRRAAIAASMVEFSVMARPSPAAAKIAVAMSASIKNESRGGAPVAV